MDSDHIDKEILTILTKDIQSHRDYLQRLYRNAFAVGGAGLILAGSFIYWVLEKQFDSKIIDYMVDANITKRLEMISADTIKRSKKTVETTIGRAQEAAIREVDRYSNEKVGAVVAESLKSRMAELTAESLPAIMKQITFPAGFVVAFDREQCPDGWDEFERGAGRMLVGVGETNDDRGETVSFAINQVGGEFQHRLKVSELPPHVHEVRAATFSNPAPEKFPTGGTYGIAQETIVSGSAGSGTPHNNLPPYVALRFCRKS